MYCLKAEAAHLEKYLNMRRQRIKGSVLTVLGQSLLVFLIAFHLRQYKLNMVLIRLKKTYILNEFEVGNPFQSKEQNKAIFWFCWLKFIDRKLSSVMTERVSNREIRSPAGSILPSGLSVRSQCHKTTLYKRHEIIRLPTRLAAAWQAKQPAESGRKRKAALCLLGSPRQALHPQGLGVHHSGLPDSKELDHDDGRQEEVLTSSCELQLSLSLPGSRSAEIWRCSDWRAARQLQWLDNSLARTAAAAGHNGPVMCDAAWAACA